MSGVYILFYLCLIHNTSIINTGKQSPIRINIGNEIVNFLHFYYKIIN